MSLHLAEDVFRARTFLRTSKLLNSIMNIGCGVNSDGMCPIVVRRDEARPDLLNSRCGISIIDCKGEVKG
jgi:hypothetical protein